MPSMPRSFAKYLRTLSENELLDLRRRAAAEIANRKAREGEGWGASATEVD
jgi:hypothetical protein